MPRRDNQYKKSFVSTEKRREFASMWSPIFARWKTEGTHPAELCLKILDHCWRDLFPNSFDVGARKTDSQNPLLQRRYRAMPAAVQASLEHWLRDKVDLQLYFDVPGVSEVLRQQSEGRRCVSLLVAEHEILNFTEDGRDFLSFLIHDLIHAEHFFADPIEFRRQVAFSRWMSQLIDQNFLHELQKNHGHLTRDFEYLVSDMNTHSVHLLKTFKALLERAPGLAPLVKPPAFADLELVEQFSHLWGQLNSPSEKPQIHMRILEIWDFGCQALFLESSQPETEPGTCPML